jgi:hypothetical protein
MDKCKFNDSLTGTVRDIRIEVGKCVYGTAKVF